MKFLPRTMESFFEHLEDIKTLDDNISVCHLRAFEDHKGEARIFVEDSLTPKEVIENIHDKKIHHLVQKNNEDFESDLKRAVDLVNNPNKYFDKDNLLIESDGINTFLMTFAGPDEKANLLEKSLNFIQNINSKLANHSALAVIEELYMNSILDAPKEAKALGLNTKEEPRLLYIAYNSDFLQISCTDFYGSLSVNKLLKRMKDVYQKGVGQSINFDQNKGAGIGCYILFEHCSTLIFGVKRGEITKVSCIIPLRRGNKRMSSLKKSLHGFEF